MRFAVLILLMGSLFVGCSTTSRLASAPDANRKLGRGSALLTMRSGESVRCYQAEFGPDSSHFLCGLNDSLTRVSTRDIDMVQVTHHLGGALEGLIVGGFGGLGVGLVAGTGYGSGGDEGMGRGWMILSMMVLGGTGGAVVGAIKGHDYTYIFPPDSTQSRSPVQDPAKQGL
jgi:hypothetical protein